MATAVEIEHSGWHAVRQAAQELASVQAVLADALRLSIEGRNAEALPAIDVLVREAERLLARTLGAFAHVGEPDRAADVR